MNVRKFIAATARDALHKVKELLGPDAIILSNRAIPGGVEIMAVAAGDMETIVPTPARENPGLQDDYTVRLSSPTSSVPPRAGLIPPTPRSQHLPPLAPRPAPQVDRSIVQTPVAAKPQAEIVPVEVLDEIRSLRKMFE